MQVLIHARSASLICVSAALMMTMTTRVPAAANPTNEQLNLDPGFRELIQDRKTIDAFQIKHYRVAPGEPPAPVSVRQIVGQDTKAIKIIKPSVPLEVANYRRSLSGQISPSRGFRAPILDQADRRPSVGPDPKQLTSTEARAVQFMNDRLAIDGLLKTLVGMIELLGHESFRTNSPHGLQRLRDLGFPDDLLACFSTPAELAPEEAASSVLQSLVSQLASGADRYTMENNLMNYRFRWPTFWTGFRVSIETGVHDLSLLRMQLGGGYENGIDPGNGIDVLGQLVRGLPDADFLVSVPLEQLLPVSQWAQFSLPLGRRNMMVLVSGPSGIENWAQDNGKAGTARHPLVNRWTRATLTPRYASREEGRSAFLPSESFVVEGIRAAGQQVYHFPLLFQGGNVLPVHDPGTGRRLLLVGEGVVHRNVGLGLSAAQLLEAFRQGFGVDECVIFPAMSYHLDFDVNIRAIDGKLVAFVNDQATALRSVLSLGVGALSGGGFIDAGDAALLQRDLAEGSGFRAHEQLTELLIEKRDDDGRFPASIASVFKTDDVDLAEGNLQVFLQALDLLAVELDHAPTTDLAIERKLYLEALGSMRTAELMQHAVLKSRGWTIVKVPSMPNLYQGINYLNGIHHRRGYIMPTYGGFYEPLDKLAERAFGEAMGPVATILGIQCAALQRKQGAVHCAVSAYPEIDSLHTN